MREGILTIKDHLIKTNFINCPECKGESKDCVKCNGNGYTKMKDIIEVRCEPRTFHMKQTVRIDEVLYEVIDINCEQTNYFTYLLKKTKDYRDRFSHD